LNFFSIITLQYNRSRTYAIIPIKYTHSECEPRVWIIAITKPVILPKWIQICTNQLLNPFTTFSDEKQQKIRQNKHIFRQNKAKYIVFTHIGRACERHRGYGSNSLWIDPFSWDRPIRIVFQSRVATRATQQWLWVRDCLDSFCYPPNNFSQIPHCYQIMGVLYSNSYYHYNSYYHFRL
jgi:hypothetical protein